MGCTADKTPMMLDLQRAAQVHSRDIEVMGINCPVQVGSIVDDRPKKDDMGIIYQRSIHASNIESWLGEALSNLQANYSLGRSVNEVSAQRTPIVFNAKLKKLYAHTVAVSISANVVLAVGFAIDGQLETFRTYRGTRTMINWANSPDSINELINEALHYAMQDLAADLNRLCMPRLQH
jgi:hypothetical protein